MTLLQYQQVLKKLANEGVFFVFLTGGEPLFNKHFEEIYSCAIDSGISATTSTNGFCLSDERIKKLKKVGMDHIQVSIHGTKATHERIVGIDGCYEKVLENVYKLEQAGISVEVVCVGLKENYAEIPSLIKDVARLGVKTFRILRYLAYYDSSMLAHVPSLFLIQETFPKILKVARENEIELMSGVCPGVIDTPYSLPTIVHPVVYFCTAGKFSMAVTTDGRVYPCQSFKERSEMCVGNIMNMEISDIWQHPIMNTLRELTPANYTGVCNECKKKWCCYSARCVAYNLTGDLYGDDLSCYIVQQKQKLNNVFY